MSMDNKQLLTEIDRAISTIINGAQEYYIGSRRVRKADLGQLMRYKKELEQQMNTNENDRLFPNTYAVYFDSR